MTRNVSARFLPALAMVLLIAACRPAPSAAPTLTHEPPTIAPTTTATAAIIAEATPSPSPTPDDEYWPKRRSMVQNQLAGRDVTDTAVLAAMETVRREMFVTRLWRDMAYADSPLPIEYGQSISQPYIVATMTQLLALEPGDKVLEIGTGSGYQAAVLAEICEQVYTIEIIPQLAESARETLDDQGYQRIISKQGDGYYGWPEAAPFDAIIVTAAPDHVPPPLLKQLAEGGRLVIPVGPPGGYQSLWVITRHGEELVRVNWGGVAFVPFTREE